MFDKLKQMKETITEIIDDNVEFFAGIAITVLAIFGIIIPLYNLFHDDTPNIVKEEIPAPPKVMLGCSDQFQLMHSDTGFRIIRDRKTGYEYIIVYTNNGIAITPRKGIIPKKETLHDMEKTEAGKEQ